MSDGHKLVNDVPSPTFLHQGKAEGREPTAWPRDLYKADYLLLASGTDTYKGKLKEINVSMRHWPRSPARPNPLVLTGGCICDAQVNLDTSLASFQTWRKDREAASSSSQPNCSSPPSAQGKQKGASGGAKRLRSSPEGRQS